MLDEPEGLYQEGLDGIEKRRTRDIVIPFYFNILIYLKSEDDLKKLYLDEKQSYLKKAIHILTKGKPL